MPRSNGTVLEDEREPVDVEDQADPDDYSPDDDDFVDPEVGDESLQGDDDADPSTESGVTASQSRLQAKIQELEAQNQELNSRIGRLAQANDDRLRETEAEWRQWGENYRRWAEEQIEDAYRRGKEEAEERLLSQLDPESKARYFDESRESERTRRQQEEYRRAQLAQQQAAQQASVAQQIAANVQAARARGVPIEALNQSNPQAVIDSMVEYLSKNGGGGRPNDEEEVDLKKTVEELQNEVKRLRRDSTGASRTGTSTGGTPRVNQELKKLDEQIAQAKRLRRPSEVIKLQRRRRELLARAR